MGDEVAHMAALYDAGWTLREIASEMHYGPVTVRKKLKGLGLSLRPRGQRPGTSRLAHAEFERTLVLRRRGCTLGQIGALLERSEATVHERLAKAGGA